MLHIIPRFGLVDRSWLPKSFHGAHGCRFSPAVIIDSRVYVKDELYYPMYHTIDPWYSKGVYQYFGETYNPIQPLQNNITSCMTHRRLTAGMYFHPLGRSDSTSSPNVRGFNSTQGVVWAMGGGWMDVRTHVGLLVGVGWHQFFF